jgi:osmoprotectant transport system permease protein
MTDTQAPDQTHAPVDDAVDAPAAVAADADSDRFAMPGWTRYVGTPIALIAITAGTLLWVFSQELLNRERAILNGERIVEELLAHMQLTIVATILVLLIAIPLGIGLTRPSLKRFRPAALAIANLGQATPSIGVLVLVVVFTTKIGFVPSVFGLVVYAILPVLRNTMVGIEQVDPYVIDAARGMGMSRRKVLTRIELPLSVPVILAGVRTTLVIVVGTAALATFIGGGGLGDFINNGIKLNSTPVLVTGAVLTAVLALAIDWIGSLVEDALRPKGL